MITGSIFYFAKALGGFVAILTVVLTVNFDTTDQSVGEMLRNAALSNHLAGGVSGLITFMALIFAGRWMLKGPTLLEKWISHSESNQNTHGEP